MSEFAKPQWHWEQTDPRRSGSSGDIAKLFKNEGVKQPGPFSVGAPEPAATLMAREVVQNSRDAARELQTELGDAAPSFEIEFEFRELVGDGKRSLIGALDLKGLAHQLGRIDAERSATRAKVGLGPVNALDHLEDETPLQVLTISESGTTGMYGPFTQARSKLFLALISVGYTMKEEGSGGSYGYGKAGLIAGSAIRTVVAYTCFRERPDDPGVTRRLLGMTYWGQHEMGTDSFTGFARFGFYSDGWVRPFENDEADMVAKSLGIKLRDPGDLDDLGTTFLVADSEVRPKELSVAIARNWWPAIMEKEFLPLIRSVNASGVTEKFDVRPKKDPLLQSFIRAWELATTQQDNNVATELRKDLGKSPASAGLLPLGFLGAHADLGGWSYGQLPEMSDDDDGEEMATANMSLVALVRGPRMVVEYLALSAGRQPYVRGVFVADEAIDELLRQTEPKAHDAWQKKVAEEGVDARAPMVANAVLRGVSRAIRDFQRRLKPPPPDPGDVHMPVFQELFKNLITGKGPGAIKPPPTLLRDVTIELKQKLFVADGDDEVFLRGHADFALSSHMTSNQAPVIVRFAYRFLEDGSAGEHCLLQVAPPVGFTRCNDGTYSGVLDHDKVRFGFESAPYSPDWAARLVVSCDIDKAAVKLPETESDALAEGNEVVK